MKNSLFGIYRCLNTGNRFEIFEMAKSLHAKNDFVIIKGIFSKYEKNEYNIISPKLFVEPYNKFEELLKSNQIIRDSDESQTRDIFLL
jgi:hypothetical protein